VTSPLTSTWKHTAVVKATGNSRLGIPGNPPPQKFPAGIPGNYWVLGESFWEFIKFPIFTAWCTYRVCQKVTPFWYPSFLPLLDALYIYNFWLLTDHFYRAMHVVLAWYCYRMLSVRPSVCLWRCCIYRVANFQKMKFGRGAKGAGIEMP